jgi:hypothetical protein
VRERLGDRPPRADLVGPYHVAPDPRLDPRVDELCSVVRWRKSAHVKLIISSDGLLSQHTNKVEFITRGDSPV